MLGHAAFLFKSVIENFANAVELSAEQGFLHLLRLFFQFVHGLDGARVATLHVGLLGLDDGGTFATGFGIKQHQIIFEFKEVFRANAKRVHQYTIVGRKLHVIHPTKCSRVLILFATGQTQFIAFNFVGVAGHIVIAHGYFEVLHKGT